MMSQEQVFFTDHSVYITNTRLVLRKGGIYPIVNLAQVSFGRCPSSRLWIGPLIFGLIFLALGALFNQNSALAGYSVLLNGEPYLAIGVSLLLIGFVSALFQMAFPLYAVVLKGSFGYARPIKRRNRRSIEKVVAALNEAITRRNAPPIVVQSTNIGQFIQDSSYRSSDIIIGQGAHVTGLNAFNNHSLNTSTNQTQDNLSAGVLDKSGGPGWAGQLSTRPDRPATQPILAGAGVRKIIISYSHEDRQWLDLLRTHLALLERQQMVALWDDTQITAGMHTRQSMTDALKVADFALLLVSKNFLASDVIMRFELPQILQRRSRSQFTILPLILSPCLYDESPLGAYQPFNPNSPLSSLSSPKRDEVLVHMAKEIQKAIS